MNASSLMGKMGSHTRQAAVELLEMGGVHFIGSDAHGVGVRRPDLREVSVILAKLVGPEGTQVLLQKNPERLLDGKPDEIKAPDAIPQKKPAWTERIRDLWRKEASGK